MDFIRLKEDVFFVRLDRGDKVNETLKNFCMEHEIKCARLHGIGALHKVELGYYDYDADIYDRRPFDGEFELLSMEGNVSLMEDDTFVHLHISMSNEKFEAIGGHLFEAEVAVTLECFIEIYDADFVRLKGHKEKFRPISF